MPIPFLDRTPELERLERALTGPSAGLACLYGRRRVGKSRLLRTLMERVPAVYYLGDERESALQRQALAGEIARLLPGFDGVEYRQWDALLGRWWSDAPRGHPLVLDEFPAIVARSPELPSLLQKRIDRDPRPIVLCGSSQRMMHGLVLDAHAPLFGRAREIIRLEPLGVSWITPALRLRDPALAVESYAVWGGVPRYWELAADFEDRARALVALVLDPLGVLHREPDRLLLDDLQDVARSSSILALIGQGCHRVTEIAARLQTPATSLSRPLVRLMDLGLIARDVPFGRSERDTKRTLYRLGDAFLAFWYRFVEPNRSRLAAGQLRAVAAEVERAWPSFLGLAWEQIARASVARIEIAGRRWRPASRWWGAATDRATIEIDIVAESVDDRRHVLVGEAKLTATAAEQRTLEAELLRNAARCPELAGRRVTAAVWLLRARGRAGTANLVRAVDVVAAS